jgi:hypothetical protein
MFFWVLKYSLSRHNTHTYLYTHAQTPITLQDGHKRIGSTMMINARAQRRCDGEERGEKDKRKGDGGHLDSSSSKQAR